MAESALVRHSWPHDTRARALSRYAPNGTRERQGHTGPEWPYRATFVRRESWPSRVRSLAALERCPSAVSVRTRIGTSALDGQLGSQAR